MCVDAASDREPEQERQRPSVRRANGRVRLHEKHSNSGSSKCLCLYRIHARSFVDTWHPLCWSRTKKPNCNCVVCENNLRKLKKWFVIKMNFLHLNFHHFHLCKKSALIEWKMVAIRTQWMNLHGRPITDSICLTDFFVVGNVWTCVRASTLTARNVHRCKRQNHDVHHSFQHRTSMQ